MNHSNPDTDPLLPTCFKTHPESHGEAKQWVVDRIRMLNPNWWSRLSQGYTETFNHTGVYKPWQEVNQRRRMANSWLRLLVAKYGSR